MAKKTPKPAPTAPAPTEPSGAAPTDRAAPPIGVVIPAAPGATVLEFFRVPDDGRVEYVTLAVLAWWIAGDLVEPITLSPAAPHTVRCVAEAHGSEMTYTFLDGVRRRFEAINYAVEYADAVLGQREVS